MAAWMDPWRESVDVVSPNPLNFSAIHIPVDPSSLSIWTGIVHPQLAVLIASISNILLTSVSYGFQPFPIKAGEASDVLRVLLC